MEKINPLDQIRDLVPRHASIFDVNRWYKTEVTTEREVNGGYGTKFPWLMAQGWKVIERRVFPQVELGVVECVFQRRIIDPELALKDLSKSLVEAFNDGLDANDMRYDDIVKLYALMLSRTEDDLGAIKDSDEKLKFETYVDDIIEKMQADFNSFKSETENILDDYGSSARADINLKYDNAVSSRRSEMITRGLYNSTVWDSTVARLESDRQRELLDLKDKITDKQIGLKDRLYTVKMDMWGKILAARDRVFEYSRTIGLSVVEVRNNALKAMMDFMERRSDSYPDLESIGNLATNMGTGNVSGVSP